jgi:hypothetical protein
MRQQQLKRRAARLGIPTAVAELLRVRRRLAILLLGDNYLRAAELSSALELRAPTLVLTSARGAARLPAAPALHSIPLGNGDARRFSCGLVALKGELTARLLMRLALNPNTSIPLDHAKFLAWLGTEPEWHHVRSLDQDLADVA